MYGAAATGLYASGRLIPWMKLFSPYSVSFLRPLR